MNAKGMTQAQLTMQLGVNKTFVQRRIEDLHLVGLVESKRAGDNIDPALETQLEMLSTLAVDLLAGNSKI
jgi:hypothetical protein